MNISGLDYEEIDSPFDSFMEREGGFLGSPGMVDMGGAGKNIIKTAEDISGGTGVDSGKTIEGQNLENLWISSWIKSRSYLPGRRGFMLDGRTGKIECGNLVVRGIGEIGGWNIDATRIYSDGDGIILDSSVPKIESGNYVSGSAGSGFHISEDLFETANISARGLIRTAVFQKDVISSVGGNLMVLDSDVLDEDMTALDTSTLTTKETTTFSAGDILRIKDGTDDEWLEVTNLIDSYSESNYTATSFGVGNGTNTKVGQSFTGNGETLDLCKFYLEKMGSPTGNAVAKVYAHAGTFGSGGLPTGAVLATSDNFDVSTLSGIGKNLETLTFTGANKITLTNGTKYFITLEYDNGDAGNYVLIGIDSSSPTHNGNAAYDNGSWVASSYDAIFYVCSFGSPYVVTRDKKGDYGADANPTWKKGATIVNYGQLGDGGIFMTASESTAPYLSVFTHAGSPWLTSGAGCRTTRLRIGNLNGYLGYGSDLYGIGIGDSTHYLKYDPTNHLRIRGDIDASTITGGTVRTSSGNPRVQLSGTNNRMEIYNNNGTNYAYFGGSGNGNVIYVNMPLTDTSPPVWMTSANNSNIFNLFNTHSSTTYPAFRIESNNSSSEVMYIKQTGSRNGLVIDNNNNSGYGTLYLRQDGTSVIVGTNVAGCYLTKGGVWTDASSKASKENFENIKVLEILKDLDVIKYNYLSEKRQSKTDIKNWLINKKKREKYSRTNKGRKGGSDDKNYLKQKISTKEDVEIEKEISKEYAQELERKIPKHISPMAEDFYKAFGLGDDNGIASKDLAGVALQAIKELSAEIDELKKIIKK